MVKIMRKPSMKNNKTKLQEEIHNTTIYDIKLKEHWDVFHECNELFKNRFEKYSDSIKMLRIQSIVDLCMMKLYRIRKINNNQCSKIEAQHCINYLAELVLRCNEKTEKI